MTTEAVVAVIVAASAFVTACFTQLRQSRCTECESECCGIKLVRDVPNE
jgi:hypothetical protein